MSKGLKKAWREAATLIIAARTADARSKFNYKILCMKRSERTSFMQNNIAFPGGGVEVQDETLDWLRYFKEAGIPDAAFKELDIPQTNRPFIFQSTKPETLNRVVSLRLTAIRETFEEVGVLICRKSGRGNFTFGSFVKDFDVAPYQKLIHDNKITFLDMCRELKVIPDLWSLYEWADWLTPTAYGKRRFDTAFFLVGLNEKPPVLVESTEAQSFTWRSPVEYLEMGNREEIFIPPPQVYEFSRLMNFTNLTDLVEFAKQRQTLGLTLHMPVQYRCSDGLCFLIPGDASYPNPVNYVEEKEQTDREVDATLEEFRLRSKQLNRCEIRGPHNIQLHNNVEMFDGHKPPRCWDFNDETRAKL